LSDLPNVNFSDEYTVSAIKTRIIHQLLNIIILIEMTKREWISGYDIIELVNSKFQEPLSPGTVYSTLYAIERKGLIQGKTDGRKTLYQLTEKGENVIEILKNSEKVLTEICQKIYEP
jgi:DNA-binding PadR family transcriptional regulator